jgi:thioredoxin-like negative regulator of GroEL
VSTAHRLRPAFTLILLTLLALPAPLLAQAQPTAAERVQPPAREDIADWQARLELAKLLTESSRHAEAAEQYRKVLRDKPDQPQARAGLARALFWSGKPGEAATELAKTPESTLTPEDRLFQAELFLSAKRHDEAIDALRGYLALKPADVKARLKLADALSWRKRLDESLAEYEKVLSGVPNDQQVRRRYARVLTWAGRNDDAIRELRKSLGN